jgi:hypothetical protein
MDWENGTRRKDTRDLSGDFYTVEIEVFPCAIVITFARAKCTCARTLFLRREGATGGINQVEVRISPRQMQTNGLHFLRIGCGDELADPRVAHAAIVVAVAAAYIHL